MSRALWVTGDTLEVARQLPDACVDLIVTSPPFLALRSYLPADDPAKANEIGQEATPAAFLDVLLDLVEEWRRILTPHGSLCVELGDTYAGSGGAGGDYLPGGLRDGQEPFDGSASKWDRSSGRKAPGGQPYTDTFKNGGPGGEGWPLPKSLCLIPQLFAVSLSYGRNPLTGRTIEPWRVRNVVRWCRPNPPVGALGDKFRPATSEMLIACTGNKRWFDLAAVRDTSKPPNLNPRAGAKEIANPDRGTNTQGTGDNPAGAPPLDFWVIPTHPYVTPDGLLIVPSGETSHRVRVPVGAPADDIRRTTSPGCPVHVSPDHPGSSASGDERADSGSNHTAHNTARPSPGQAAGSPPTPLTLDLPGDAGSPADLAATPHSSGSSRTDPGQSTSPSGTPSGRNSDHTADTGATQESAAPHPDTNENRTSAVGSDGSPTSRTADRTDDTDSEPVTSEACTCSYFVEIDVAPEVTSDYADNPPDWWNIPTHGYKGSHYATFPPALVVKPVEAMCPRQVCTVCGQPSTRIVEVDGLAGRDILAMDGENDRGTGLQGKRPPMPDITRTTIGWSDCGHNAWRPGRVLDPFGGSGTTLEVATGHGRDGIGIDLDRRNAELARERIGGLFFTELTAPELAAELAGTQEAAA